MNNVERDAARQKALESLRRICNAVGAHLNENPFRDPMGNVSTLTVTVRIKDWEYCIVPGYIFRLSAQYGLHATCYHTATGTEPPADCMLSVLLLLRNDPAIFNRWERQDGFYS